MANLHFQLSWDNQITLLPPPRQHHSFFRNFHPLYKSINFESDVSITVCAMLDWKLNFTKNVWAYWHFCHTEILHFSKASFPLNITPKSQKCIQLLNTSSLNVWCQLVTELWQPKGPPRIDFLMVITASGIARGCMPDDNGDRVSNVAAILQLIG